MSAHEIRRRFVEFFTARAHQHVPSSSLVPKNDPSLLFVNAGMNQFKDVFTGRETRPYSRAVTVQKCVRAGGKHNDLDNVGFTPKHHTFFEMLGNFSFGDYFKKEAIAWGWEFLTGEMKLPAERLAVTVFDGTGEDAPADDEAYELWRAFVPENRIYRCSATDNFWAMGETGPCGPCSEIHLFGGEVEPGLAKTPGRGPAFDGDAYVELWNLVFMQYEKHPDRSTTKLPKPSIDTGSGLERFAAAVAGLSSNYETDLLSPMVEFTRQLAGDRRPKEKGEAPLRVIADHARATAFLIADGVFPDKGTRNYVLRRIMRRAIRHGTEIGLDQPFFHEVCRVVVDGFGDVYPELRERAATIDEVVRAEEESFRRTLSRGLRLLKTQIDLHEASAKAFSVETAAVLYDTYGFPIDLTSVIVAEHGLTLDEAATKEKIKELQGGGEGGGELGSDKAVADQWFALHGELGDTEFLGYDTTEADATVRGLVVAGQRVHKAEPGQEVDVVLDRTPFYGESGGQIGDTGRITTPGGATLEVSDAMKPLGGMIVHRACLTGTALSVGDRVHAAIDVERRNAIRRNHSATHLLHHALRKHLGEHVVQKGSLVAPDRLRFDFSHNRPISIEERHEIEKTVNEMVLANAAADVRQQTMDEAKARKAIGLFEAKYGERVRVVQFAASIELCGGTHVSRTGDIGMFAIVSEGGIAQGVRRIEAVTGMGAVAWAQGMADLLDHAKDALHAHATEDVPPRIEKLQKDMKGLQREIDRLQQQIATGGGAGEQEIVEVQGVKLLAKRVAVDAKALRGAADALRDKLRSGVVVLGAETDGKATLLVAVTKDLEGRVHAGKLVAAIAGHVDGKGGGKPELAQAGGPKVAGLDAALQAARDALAEQLRG